MYIIIYIYIYIYICAYLRGPADVARGGTKSDPASCGDARGRKVGRHAEGGVAKLTRFV